MQIRRDAKWPTAKEMCGRQCPELIANTQATLEFAQDWAERMEISLMSGKRSLAQAAEATRQNAKGYQAQNFSSYKMVVELLGSYWEHGVELVDWYNRLCETAPAPQDTIRLIGKLGVAQESVRDLKVHEHS